MISDELNVILNCGRSASIPSEFDKKIVRSEFETLHGNLIYIAILLDLQQAQFIKNKIVKREFIYNLAAYIDNVEYNSFQGSEEFLNALFLIVEGLSSNQKILIQMSEPILKYLLIVLIKKIKSDSANIRFLSLKIFTDIIIQYLNDDSIYQIAPTSTTNSQTQISESGLNPK